MNSNEFTQLDALKIIKTVGSTGQPPPWGVELFTDGFEDILSLIEKEYIKTLVALGGSAFKLIVGHFGGGKTHFLYLLRNLGWKYNYAVSYVSLTPHDCPFHRLELVYRAIASNLTHPPVGRELEQGLEPFIKYTIQKWRENWKTDEAFSSIEAQVKFAKSTTANLENYNFRRAMSAALTALISNQETGEEEALELIQWLSAQGSTTNISGGKITGVIDRSTAFSSWRSLATWIGNAGYTGLLILFDEAERIPSMSGKQKEFMMSNLREVIDETARCSLERTFVVYAIPDFRFFDGSTGVYEAVKQRVAPVFDFYNPSGVRINLEEVVPDAFKHLVSIGTKLWGIFETAYGIRLPFESTQNAVKLVAEAVLETKFADISFRRLFVQSVVQAFERIRREDLPETDPDWAYTIVQSFLASGV